MYFLTAIGGPLGPGASRLVRARPLTRLVYGCGHLRGGVRVGARRGAVFARLPLLGGQVLVRSKANLMALLMIPSVASGVPPGSAPGRRVMTLMPGAVMSWSQRLVTGSRPRKTSRALSSIHSIWL